MNNDLFIPQKINVGFNKRTDTYTQMLAYVIYYDEKGVLRKEKSWNSWRDQKIPNQEFDNIPTAGFVLNRHAGGYSSGWNYRQSYIRVYDPRNFEFEITVENLLYILENCDCIKGKGLEGEFVYSWSGTELVLLPVNSPDYQNIAHYNEKILNAEKITNKTLVVGRTYRKKNNQELLYLGQFECFGWNNQSEGLKHLFTEMKHDDFFTLYDMKSVNGKFIETISTEPPENFDKILERLMHNNKVSPEGRRVAVPLTFTEIQEMCSDSNVFHLSLLYKENGKERIINRIRTIDDDFVDEKVGELDENTVYKFETAILEDENTFHIRNFDYERKVFNISFKEFFEKYYPYTYFQYLQNGRLSYTWISRYKTVFSNTDDLYGKYMRIPEEEAKL